MIHNTGIFGLVILAGGTVSVIVFVLIGAFFLAMGNDSKGILGLAAFGDRSPFFYRTIRIRTMIEKVRRESELRTVRNVEPKESHRTTKQDETQRAHMSQTGSKLGIGRVASLALTPLSTQTVPQTENSDSAFAGSRHHQKSQDVDIPTPDQLPSLSTKRRPSLLTPQMAPSTPSRSAHRNDIGPDGGPGPADLLVATSTSDELTRQ
ncbi:hypothetical protein BGY98DRAFT_1152409 [Russula aff. rugulosa BPL654]|nr:hypothetical protein BGY98DRAFT_1152409 [Russula aff. rugulosa BPL654]